ncbi:MAG: hypothetical protein GX126_13035 [Bacteroidales bacterium]|nr:hypothetical protein [Bacteroidales bacterium]
MLKRSFFNKYLLPGFIFQSVIIGGGYGTGRELVEYFLRFGPVGGLLGMLLVVMVVWSVFLALTFEFSRLFRAFDYRIFFKKLLGRAWPVFEVTYIAYLIIVLAVLGSASGVLLRDSFNAPYLSGVLIMLVIVGYLTFKGSALIEKILSFWSLVLYLVYALLLVFTFIKFGPDIKNSLTVAEIEPGWFGSGIKYALYNLANVVGILFCLRHIETRREALISGVIAGFTGIIPALLFYFSIIAYYPEILPVELPSVYAFGKLNIPFLYIAFQVILFGTLVETGTALIHAVNERVQSTFISLGKKLPRYYRPLIASVFLLAAFGISLFGLVNLIAKGYGTVSWGFLIVYILPLATIGLYKILKTKAD